MRNERFLWLVASALIGLSANSYSAVRKGQAGIGLNTQGIHGRYFFGDHWAGEFKMQFDDDISIAGLRGLRYFQSETNVPLFVGLEGDVISFETTQVAEKKKGSGYAAELFMGGEYFFSRRFSFQMDIGPAYIHLSEEFGDDEFSAEGWEVVANFAINFYFRI